MSTTCATAPHCTINWLEDRDGRPVRDLDDTCLSGRLNGGRYYYLNSCRQNWQPCT